MSDFLQRDVGSTERGAPRDLRLHDYEKFGMNNETFMREARRFLSFKARCRRCEKRSGKSCVVCSQHENRCGSSGRFEVGYEFSIRVTVVAFSPHRPGICPFLSGK
jgi:hypothetical protein